MAPKARPQASNWDKLRTRAATETHTHRDVHGRQQLDRARLRRLRSRGPGAVLAVIAGILVAAVAWVLFSVLAVLAATVGAGLGRGPLTGAASPTAAASYWSEQTTTGPGGAVVTCYRPVDRAGRPVPTGPCYPSAGEVPVPDWFAAASAAPTGPGEPRAASRAPAPPAGLAPQLTAVSALKLVTTLGPGLVVALMVLTWSARRVAAANLMRTTADINQHENDQHIALPEEIQREYDWFPDAGAHSAVQVSSLISHVMLQRKGLGTVAVPQRATADLTDETGAVRCYAGEVLEDAHGDPVVRRLPLIDEDFGQDLFAVSGVPDDPRLRRTFDARVIAYNPGGTVRDKLGPYPTVADLITADWELPDYEVQRPAGAYLVDTAPVNTMVLAMTRAGKGQTYIEPLIDVWTREKRPSNLVINDPKGELLVKTLVKAVRRGYAPIQFNLINPMNTDIYNPLGLAAEAAREGDATKCALYVENIADVFFPLDGGEDPVWPNAANNAFKRAAYGLIDFYLEEERELREAAALTGMDPQTLEQRLDDLWGRVTLYNCYQLFVQLTARKLPNPQARLEERIADGEFAGDAVGLAQERERAAALAAFWEGKPEQDMLTLYFNATEALPANTMRTLVGNANNALRAMAGAEKMLASVYGIAITAMSFFTDPTISALTSGKPSQNTDLGGLSFPRRLGVRFSADYVKREHLQGLQAVWTAYADPRFTEPLGADFAHDDLVSREGWARYYFKGVFPTDHAYLKLELVNPQNRMLVRTFRFHFTKGYQLSLNGRHYVKEPVTGAKIVKNGILRELRPADAGATPDGTPGTYTPGDTLYPQTRLDLSGGGVPEKVDGRARAIIQTSVRYAEKPKAVFLVTPPHLSKYAKLLLILLKQLVDLNFDKSYLAKADQKPLYRTRFMLDELGNLQSDGHGISGFETMLSIGLGQDQQFTVILQTLQQLRDIYGDVDRIVLGNIANIIFLKSTDDAMLETLEKMSGQTHVSRIDSKQISQDVDRMVGGRTDSRVSYTMTTSAEPLITYTDLASLPARNSIVFRAGKAPVWNRNETILPMSYKLLGRTPQEPGRDYNLKTIPTLSSAGDFDVRRNQPDFVRMLTKRMAQAHHAGAAKQTYQEIYGYSDVQIARLDPDVYADEVMRLVTQQVEADAGRDPHAPMVLDPDDDEGLALLMFDPEDAVEDTLLAAEVARRRDQQDRRRARIYAEGRISQDMLINPDGSAKLKSLDRQLAEACQRTRIELERDRDHFSLDGDGALCSADGTRVYLSRDRSASAVAGLHRLTAALHDPDRRVYAEQDLTPDDLAGLSTVTVHAAFYQFLASLPSWEDLAGGEFDRAMAREMKAAE